MLPAANILIKPASSACNMACRYCFYRDVAEHRHVGFKGMLSTDNLEVLVRNALGSTQFYCGFAFQGGEPMLAGLDFYKRLIELQRQYNTGKVRIQNSIQTNGCTLDEEWAVFLRDNHFLVGLSLDGPAEVHNANRPDSAGKDTFNRVMKALHLLQRHQVDCNILSVVTARGADHIGSIYRFMLKQGMTHLQFIPCLEPLECAPGESEWFLSTEKYGKFLVRLWDLWFADLRKGKYTSVRHIDNWLSLLMGERAEACNMTGRCSVQFVVEGDGGVYPCDFYVHDEWRLGDISESLEQLQQSDVAKRFVEASHPVPETCLSCRWGGLCRNGCRRERWSSAPRTTPVNRYCEALRYFFDARFEQVNAACSILRRMRSLSR